MNTQLIADTLAQHPDYGFNAALTDMTCTGTGCEWSKLVGMYEQSPPIFRKHQADMIADALEAAPAPMARRDDLTVFAALLARLGGETLVTWEEVRRLTGVTVTRYDDPANMAYRFELGAEGLKAVATVPAAHQCESWQIRRNTDGGRYCAACGATK